jgi:glycosyltransferase involved in cell wall biosynthesis
LAFNKDPKVKLLIHARGGDDVYTNKVLAFLDVIKNPQVAFSKNSLAKQDYLNFMQSVDMLVNVSKGEGFSIQPREAMALGIPVLITDNTAQASIVKNATCSSLVCTLKEPAFYNHLKAFAGHFMDYSVEELAEKLKDAYANRYELLKAKEENKIYAASFHYSKVKPLYKNIIAPKKVVLGQQNKIHEEYLETSSPELFEKYMKLTGANQ